MKISVIFKYAMPVCLALLLFSVEAHAQQLSTDVLTSFLAEYANNAGAGAGWVQDVLGHATKLFLTLSVVSLVFTFGFMAMRQADFGELFSELVRYVIFTTFFLWLLTQGPEFAEMIFRSLAQIGTDARPGSTSFIEPTTIAQIGFNLFAQVVAQLPSMDLPDSYMLIAAFLALCVLVILALIGINIILMYVSIWVLAYGGVFLLGFGSSRWTSDIAVGYYKSVLAVAVSWLSMILLLSLGVPFLEGLGRRVAGTSVNFNDLAVMLVAALALFVLTNKIPALLASIVTGARVGGAMNVTGMVSATVVPGGAPMTPAPVFSSTVQSNPVQSSTPAASSGAPITPAPVISLPMYSNTPAVSGGDALRVGIATAASNTQKIVEMFRASREDAAKEQMAATKSAVAQAYSQGASPAAMPGNGDFLGRDQSKNTGTGAGLSSVMGPTVHQNASSAMPVESVNKQGQASQAGQQGMPAHQAHLAGAGAQQTGSGMVNVTQPPVSGQAAQSSLDKQAGMQPGQSGSGIPHVAQPADKAQAQPANLAGAGAQQTGSGMSHVAQPAASASVQPSPQTLQQAAGNPQAQPVGGSNVAAPQGQTPAAAGSTQSQPVSNNNAPQQAQPLSAQAGGTTNNRSQMQSSSNTGHAASNYAPSNQQQSGQQQSGATGSRPSYANKTHGATHTPATGGASSSDGRQPVGSTNNTPTSAGTGGATAATATHKEHTKTVIYKKKPPVRSKKNVLIDKLLGRDGDDVSDADDEISSFRDGKKE